MNEQSEKSRKQFTYESTIKEFYYDRSVVPIEKPLEKMDWKLRQWCKLQQSRPIWEETEIQGFCQHL